MAGDWSQWTFWLVNLVRLLLPIAPETFAGQVEAAGDVDKAVEDRVDIGRVANHNVPVLHRELPGDDGRSAAVAFVKDFRQVMARLGVQRFQSGIIEDAEPDAAEHAGAAAITAGECQVTEQLWDACVEHRAMIAARLVAQGAGWPTVADCRSTTTGIRSPA